MSTEQTQTLRNVILQGDCRETLKTVQDESVECVITSPPYLWLRDYGVEGQIGLEKTMNDYLETLWGIFDIIRAKLKPSGTVWVNLGDTYSGMKVGNTNNNMKEGISEMDLVKPRSEIKDKSLMAIPDRFKIGMIDRGWICRNEIIWWKRNAMPSSAKDRFTVDFEKVFFFTKNQKYYFETQYEPYSEATMKEIEKPYTGQATKIYDGTGAQNPSDAKRSMVNSIRKNMPKFGGNKAAGYGNPTYSGKEWKPKMGGDGTSWKGHSGNMKADGTPICNNPLGRLKRTVWDIPTKPFKEAHFATYPEELVKTCMISGCPEFVCVRCGRPRESIFEPSEEYSKLLGQGSIYRRKKEGTVGFGIESGAGTANKSVKPEYYKVGLSDCGCGAEFKPGIVLDPFFGSGTTGVVALKNGRDFIGCELNPEYIKIAEKRLEPYRNQMRL